MIGKRKGLAVGGLLVAAAAVVMLMSPSHPRAQGNMDAIRAREALDRTDEVISRAKAVVDESRSQKGRVSLEIATGIQGRAWESFRGNRFATAGKLTIEARDEAWHAIALARSDAQGEESLARITEETTDRLARVRDMMAQNGVRDEQSIRLADEARSLLEKSRINAQQLRYQLALKLAGNARTLTMRAEERIRNARSLKEMAERRLELLDRLVARARDRVRGQNDEKALGELALAERHLEKAKALIDEGRYREARQALDTCEKILRSSVRLVPPLAATDPAGQLEEARRLLGRAEEVIAEQGGQADPRTVETLAGARAMLGRAESALAEGRPAEARDLIARSREMLRAAVRIEAQDLTRERIMERIARIEALREETGNLAASCPVPGVRDLMDRAEEHLRLAREHTEASRLESAGAEATIARNLYQRISEICAR